MNCIDLYITNMQARKAPRFIWMTRDIYRAFFGINTALTFGFGMIEQGAKVFVPTFVFLYLARSINNE